MADQYNTGVVDPSTEITDVDSRKRPLDASSDIRQPFKRSNFGGNLEFVFHYSYLS